MKKRLPEHQNEEIWLITYADLITLLLCFFIILYTSASMNKGQWERIKASYKSSIARSNFTTTIEQVKSKIDSSLIDELRAKNVYTNLDENGITLGFVNSSLYNSGESELNADGKLKIDRIVRVIHTFNQSAFFIDVEGYTDDNPISNERFTSNWELSVLRATNVVRYFIQKNIAPSRLKASGYADTNPLVPNRDALGKPIPSNQAKNRRVLIRIHY
ncbi:MAG: flagellar motor protein MotB [Bacteroidota bacterium]